MTTTENARRILVIEDNPGVLENISTILRFEGYQVLGASDGRAGLTVALRDEPDLVISDIMMPKMNGVEVLQALRSRAVDVPFLLISAKASRGDIRAGMNMGADDYLTKPFTIEELREAVQSLFAKDRLRRSPERDAKIDPATGLPTLAALRDECAAGFGKRAALIHLQLGRLKTFRVVLGENAAADIRREVVQALRSLESDAHRLFQVSGEEFVFLVRNVEGADEAREFARLVLSLLDARKDRAAVEVDVSPAAGIALFPEHGTQCDALLRNATLATQKVRFQGRTKAILFHPELERMATSRLELEGALRRARDREELFLLFQPKFDLATGRLDGVEALLRWTHATLGPISPADFIPVAEETGFIETLGVWVMKTALLQIAAWQVAGFRIPVAVNVSPRQLERDRFVLLVKTLIEQFQVDPSLLELEITEGALADRDAIARCHELKKLGVRLAMDDFGTGYSSLAYLKQMPLDTVKIDRSFVRDLPEDATGRELCQAVVSLTRGLGMRTVAEGVETDAQANFLRDLRCDIAQGFLYSPAVAPEKILEFAARPFFGPDASSEGQK